ncbi:MAG: gamma-glutamylcyclotransferase [Planctomycetia bacterium]|nr:gamma-glutamylcyclotransferase [Planctomycetia bacterium]
MTNEQLVFGYGSLVNRRTLPPGVRTTPAVLPGWRREWTHAVESPQGNVCALSVARDAATEIEGVLLSCDPQQLAELDRREIGYHRVRVPVRLGPGRNVACLVYVGDAAQRRAASHEFPIWRSYLDCVVAGYLELGGRAAVERFIATTRGWNAPILNDRPRPKYARAVDLSSDQRCEIDEILRERGLLEMLVDLGSTTAQARGHGA